MLGERDVVYYPEDLSLLGSVFDQVNRIITGSHAH